MVCFLTQFNSPLGLSFLQSHPSGGGEDKEEAGMGAQEHLGLAVRGVSDSASHRAAGRLQLCALGQAAIHWLCDLREGSGLSVLGVQGLKRERTVVQTSGVVAVH